MASWKTRSIVFSGKLLEWPYGHSNAADGESPGRRQVGRSIRLRGTILETALLEVTDLTCVRGDRPLFTHLDFVCTAGELWHVRGPNGCGKTTLLRTLCGLSRPEHGAIRWRGTAIDDERERYLGELRYVGHHDGVQGDLTPAENLRHYAALHADAAALAAIPATLAALRLAADAAPAKFLSQGQRRRLGLARLFLSPRPLWILDEPFTSLDTDSIAQIVDAIGAHCARGGSAILTSHQPLDAHGARTLDLAAWT